MSYLSASDQQAIEDRADYILGVISPKAQDLRPVLEAYRSILQHTPALKEYMPEIYKDAHEIPLDQFMFSILSSACAQVALAEITTGTRYADNQLYDKLHSDLSEFVENMAEIERSSHSSGRLH